MKSLAERKKERAKDRKEVEEASAFAHADFLRNGRSGKNDPGKDTSKGSTEGTNGDGTTPNADDQSKKDGGEGGGEAGKGGNANKPAKPVGDAEKARQEAAKRTGGAGWGSQGAGGNPGSPGGSQSPNPSS